MEQCLDGAPRKHNAEWPGMSVQCGGRSRLSKGTNSRGILRPEQLARQLVGVGREAEQRIAAGNEYGIVGWFTNYTLIDTPRGPCEPALSLASVIPY